MKECSNCKNGRGSVGLGSAGSGSKGLEAADRGVSGEEAAPRVCRGVKIDGTPSLEELRRTPGYPSEERIRKGPVAIIECVEEIPCNPCETACPQKAISVGADITALPVLDEELCTGCGVCVAACPGLAIYVKDYTFEENRATILFPFEYLPLPEKGQTVDMTDRFGRVVCEGEVLLVNTSRRNNNTVIIKAAFDKSFFEEVVSIRRLPRE
ncbi:MAG: 4Fe-4S binding protein [Spirochaetota bacterium]|nr:4Fe-4S binding protein [Spirochaetota bacterium]